MSLEFQKSSYYDRVSKIIDGLKLKDTPNDNEIIKNRFLYEVMQYEYKRDNTKKYYNGFQFILTIGTILLPAILSIGQMDPEKLPKNFDNISYWSSWVLSLTVTACNGFLQLFSLDKNYIAYTLVTEQLKTEGWQYLQLSGKYENAESHSQSFKQFCKSIENIKRKQIEQEYNGKASDQKNNFNFEKELNTSLPQQYQQNEQKPLENMSNALDIVDRVSDLKHTLKATTDKINVSLESKDIGNEIISDIVDKSLKNMEGI